MSDYPEEIWLYKPWPDHPSDVSKIWTGDAEKGQVRYIRADLVAELVEDMGCPDCLKGITDGC